MSSPHRCNASSTSPIWMVELGAATAAKDGPWSERRKAKRFGVPAGQTAAPKMTTSKRDTPVTSGPSTQTE